MMRLVNEDLYFNLEMFNVEIGMKLITKVIKK